MFLLDEFHANINSCFLDVLGSVWMCCGMGIGGIESESPILDTIKGLYYLSTTTPPLPREVPFAGQNRAGRGVNWVKGLGPVPERTIPHDW